MCILSICWVSLLMLRQNKTRPTDYLYLKACAFRRSWAVPMEVPEPFLLHVTAIWCAIEMWGPG